MSAPNIPAMHSTNQTVRIRHKEYIGPIIGSVGFSVRALTINPINEGLFPWLSRIAQSFQQYTIKGMMYHYVPTSGIAISGSNPALGTVMLQTSYRAGEPVPRDKAEMMNEYWATEGAPNNTFLHPIECDIREMPFAIHYVGTPSTADQTRLMYDWGSTYIATQGMPAANPVGDLWVTYDIEFKKPEVYSDAIDVLISEAVGPSNSVGTLFNSLVWSAGSFVTATGNTVTFPTDSGRKFLLVTAVKAADGSPFTVADMGTSGVVDNCTVYRYERNVLGGTTPSLFNAMRYDFVDITDPDFPATYKMATPSLTPNSGLTVNLFVARLRL
jgi:hypothetical protein